MTYTPLEVAIAISLYTFNVPAMTRAKRLYDYFDGECAELCDLITILLTHPGSLVTHLALPTAKVYVDHALYYYGREAKERVSYLNTHF